MFGLSEIIVLVAIGWVISRVFRRINPSRHNTLDRPVPPQPLTP